jgi:hypothetical protein
MLKFKGGGRLQNFLELRDKVFGYWREILSIPFLDSDCCRLSKIFYYERMIRTC